MLGVTLIEPIPKLCRAVILTRTVTLLGTLIVTQIQHFCVHIHTCICIQKPVQKVAGLCWVLEAPRHLNRVEAALGSHELPPVVASLEFGVVLSVFLGLGLLKHLLCRVFPRAANVRPKFSWR